MPTFSRTTCNGVTVEPEVRVDTHEWKEEQQREKPELPTRFAKLTNYLAIRWQRAPNLQVFTLHPAPREL